MSPASFDFRFKSSRYQSWPCVRVESPESLLDRDELDLTWQEIAELLRQCFRAKISKLHWQEIIDTATDYNYEPDRFRIHVANILKNVEAALAGEADFLSGRATGIAALRLDDAPSRREILDILRSGKNLDKKASGKGAY